MSTANESDTGERATGPRYPLGTRAVRLDLHPDDHERLKELAAHRGKSMAATAKTIVLAYLAAWRSGR